MSYKSHLREIVKNFNLKEPEYDYKFSDGKHYATLIIFDSSGHPMKFNSGGHLKKKVAEDEVSRLAVDFFERVSPLPMPEKNFKNLLQQLVQTESKGSLLPTYTTWLDTDSNLYLSYVKIGSFQTPVSTPFQKKKDAEKDAARIAYNQLSLNPKVIFEEIPEVQGCTGTEVQGGTRAKGFIKRFYSNQSMNQQPMNQQHMNQQPMNQQHMNQQPMNQQHMNQQPMNQQHMNQQPSNNYNPYIHANQEFNPNVNKNYVYPNLPPYYYPVNPYANPNMPMNPPPPMYHNTYPYYNPTQHPYTGSLPNNYEIYLFHFDFHTMDDIKLRISQVEKLLGIEKHVIQEALPHLFDSQFSFSEHENDIKSRDIREFIDHTLLKQDASSKMFEKLCQEAKSEGLHYICVPGTRLNLVLADLIETNVKVAVVVGFPHGNQSLGIKALEASRSIEKGAFEIDMVIDIGKLKDRDYKYVYEDIKSVVLAVKQFGTEYIVKVIIETCLLTKEEIIDACILSVLAGADYVKTSTGFSSGGAKLEDVTLMKTVVGKSALVKASGGIKTYADAMKMLLGGASRIGTSSGVDIVNKVQS